MASRRLLVSLAALLATAAPAQQPVTSAAPDAVAVTIYRAADRDDDDKLDLDWLEGYALITETRTVDIPAGPATIRFEGVAGGMLPESALVSGLPAGVREKNLDADLLSPASLYARSFGRPVILRREHPKTGKVLEERAIIRSGPDGSVIVQTSEGFEAADCGPLNDSLVYPALPAGLSARPTLSIETDAPAPARAVLSLSYLAWGFDWQGNYVVHMLPGGKQADITAWVTLASSDPTSFVDASAAVVGGKVNREDYRDDRGDREQDRELVFHCNFSPLPPPPPAPPSPPAMAVGDIIVTAMRRTENLQSVPLAITVKTEDLGDLKLFRIPVPTSVAANAQKQVAMFDKRGVKVAIVYTASIFDGNAGDVLMTIRARNEEKDGLGIPLPSGAVAVFEPHDGEPMLVGEGQIADKAVGEDVEVVLADSSQVEITSEDVDSGKAKRGEEWSDYAVEVTNANRWPITFEASLRVRTGMKLEHVSRRLGRKNGRPLWQVRVPANGSAKLRYRLSRMADE